jgi:hypothetical protein
METIAINTPIQKGSLVLPLAQGPRKDLDTLGHVRSLPLHFCKRLFPGLEPMTLSSQANSFTAAPRLPFKAINTPIYDEKYLVSNHTKLLLKTYAIHNPYNVTCL